MTSPNENPESTEENINTQTRKDPNLYSRLVKLYVEDNMKEKSGRLAFAKSLDASKSISEKTLKDIEQFARKNKDFDGLEVNKDTISPESLKREVVTFLANISQKKNQIRETFLKEFDVDTSLYHSKISPKIDALSQEKELDELLGDFEMRKRFLKGIFPKNTPPLRTTFSFLK